MNKWLSKFNNFKVKNTFLKKYIGGSRGGVRDACPPLGIQILSISCSFRENLACSRPPSGKSWIRHWNSYKNMSTQAYYRAKMEGDYHRYVWMGFMELLTRKHMSFKLLINFHKLVDFYQKITQSTENKILTIDLHFGILNLGKGFNHPNLLQGYLSDLTPHG